MVKELSAIIEERGARYGEFKDNAGVAQDLKERLRRSNNWNKLPRDCQEALDQISAKISRIMCGDPNYDDNWDDIAGYATRVAMRIREEKSHAHA